MIDNALVEPGRQLEVTEELAQMLGIDGTVELEWRFATSGTAERRYDSGRERTFIATGSALANSGLA